VSPEKSFPGEKAANPNHTENRSHYNASNPAYEARLAGWLEGYHSRDAEVGKLNWTADRYYTEMIRRPAKPFEPTNAKSYADLERIRGNSANADRVDAANRARFAEVAK
jgi:hypothetical protein